nr:hypothetical protein [Allomuricauda sp.]
MKPYSFFFLLTFSTLLFFGCSDDDGEPNDEPEINLSVVGVYDLVEANVNIAQDLNMDNTTSTNLVTELDCLTGTLLIDSDFTWTFEQSGLSVTSITGGLFFADCAGSTTESGTWTSTQTQLILSGGNELGTLRISGNRLFNDIGEDLPGIRAYVYERRDP